MVSRLADHIGRESLRDEITHCRFAGVPDSVLSTPVHTLRSRLFWDNESTPALKIGDVVLIIDFQAPRNLWRTARVVEVYPNKRDQVIRVVKVRAGKKELTRPVHKLVRIFGD